VRQLSEALHGLDFIQRNPRTLSGNFIKCHEIPEHFGEILWNIGITVYTVVFGG
jgi:hypothetical protein